MDFTDLSKSFKSIKLKGGTTNGFVRASDNLSHKENYEKKIENDKAYVQYYVEKQKKEFLDYSEKDIDESQEKKYEKTCGDLSSVGTVPDYTKIDDDDNAELYAHYFKIPPKETNELVISQFKYKILSMIEANEVIIISGPTGCGKTTKVPQYILDSHAEKNQFCNIIVSQPRRIAAITIAKRVCDERGWPLTSICGYKVGLQDHRSADTRLTYVTVGVLLQILLNKKHMNDFTHIILDEVHERDQDTDFALLLVKQLLHTNSRNVKVILMSATADATKFANYFARRLCNKFQPAPIICIEKSSEYIVNIHYLEELSSLGKLPIVCLSNPSLMDPHVMTGINLIKRFEVLDGNTTNKKSVLVFLPGIHEIEQFYDKLNDPEINRYSEYKWHCVPLHSSITIEEQVQAFLPAPTGHRKIILATNIAESSITVPDVMFVIDYCLTRVLITDSETNFTCLQLCWASKDNLKQRAGRAGRVMNGRVYRMIYRDNYNELDEHCIPGMLRCPLERTVLQAKKLNIGPPKVVLALAMDPPDLKDIARTILILKEIGGLLLTKNGSNCDNDGDLTSLGNLMASLPVDIHIGRLIALGYVFNCLEECVIMGAALSLKSIFSNPFQAQLESYTAKLDWADGSCSDCLAFLNVYQLWKNHHKNGYFKRSINRGELSWTKRHFIQLRVLKEVDKLIQEINMRLNELGVEESVEGPGLLWSNVEKSLVLKFVIAGAFYPNYFTRGARGGQVNEKEALRILCGRNPFNTIYLQNYPLNQPHDLYSDLIKEKLSFCKENMKVSYDHSKVFIEFFVDDDTSHESDVLSKREMPSKISASVYKAVKMRDVIKNFEIEVLPYNEAVKLSDSLNDQERQDALQNRDDNFYGSLLNKTNLPRVENKLIEIKITHIENSGCFWATKNDEISQQIEKNLVQWLNGPHADIQVDRKLPEVGDIVVAPMESDNMLCLYRARVESVKKNFCKVFFIDFGISKRCPTSQLRKYGTKLRKKIDGIPGQAFECTLMVPSIENFDGKRRREIEERFRQIVVDGPMMGKVVSVISKKVSLSLYKIVKEGEQRKYIDVNKWLVDEVYEENQLSQMNFERNNNLSDVKNSILANNLCEQSSSSCSKFGKSLKIPVVLRGPFSPLEMKIFSVTQGGASKVVKISPMSVNSVLLDSNPQDPHERLIVAGNVGQNQSGTALILHNTTIMPNIHGLAALIPLVFAPNVEIRVNDQNTLYTGVLCGLGVNEVGESLFPEHDMEIIFDCEFTFDDLITVNRLRYLMGRILGYSIACFPSYTDLIELHRNLKECFVSLMKKQRRSKELEFPLKQFQWNLLKKQMEQPSKEILKENCRGSIFPIHALAVINSNEERKKKLLEHLTRLREIVNSSQEGDEENLRCNLCKLKLRNKKFLGLHLASESHLANEDKLLDN